MCIYCFYERRNNGKTFWDTAKMVANYKTAKAQVAAIAADAAGKHAMNQNTAHTQGPWEWDRQANINGDVDPLMIYGPDGMSVALVTDRGGAAPANARLIAAAPDLLAYAQMEEDRMTMPVLTFRKKWNLGTDEANGIAEFRRAAIARAEGR